VRIALEQGLLRLSIDDDGKGLPTPGAIRRGGLLGIEERLEMVNGSLELQPGQTSGLQVRIVLPLNDEQEEKA
jgi:two-component system sensor histidine kinase UhpB